MNAKITAVLGCLVAAGLGLEPSVASPQSIQPVPSPPGPPMGLRWQLTPTIGMYVPHGSALLEYRARDTQGGLRKKPVGRPVFATRLAAWPRPNFGLEATAAYSPALIAVHRSGVGVRDVTAGFWLVSARTVLRLNPEELTDPQQFAVHLASGIGLVRRVGEAWEDTPVRTAFAIVVGAGARTPLGPRVRGVAFRFELEDYISWPEFSVEPGAEARSKPYHDLILSLGFAIPLVEPR